MKLITFTLPQARASNMLSEPYKRLSLLKRPEHSITTNERRCLPLRATNKTQQDKIRNENSDEKIREEVGKRVFRDAWWISLVSDGYSFSWHDA